MSITYRGRSTDPGIFIMLNVIANVGTGVLDGPIAFSHQCGNPHQ